MRAMNGQQDRSFASITPDIAELPNRDVHRIVGFAEERVYARNFLGISLRNLVLQSAHSEPLRNSTELAGSACPTVSARRCR